MGHAARANLSNTKARSTEYLRTLAALLIEQGGEARIPATTFALLDPQMVVRQTIEDDGKTLVLRLVAPDAEASH